MTDPAPSGIQLGADLPLSAVLGFQSVPAKDNALSRERVAGVAKWLGEVAREIPALGLLEVAPGMVRELARVLATPLSEIGITLWNKRQEIRKFADETRYPATEAHEVDLYEHEFKQTVKPTIEIRLNDRALASVTLTATASVTLKSARLVIRGGWITHVRLGELTGKAVLGVEQPKVLAKLKLKEVKSESWKLDQEIALPGKGVRIRK